MYDRIRAKDEHSQNDDLRRLLWFLLGGKRGGENRARILYEIRRRPSNMNQLARALSVNYRAVQHHINILMKNSLVVRSGERYGSAYSIHPWLEYHFSLFEQIVEQLSFPSLKKSLAPKEESNLVVPVIAS